MSNFAPKASARSVLVAAVAAVLATTALPAAAATMSAAAAGGLAGQSSLPIVQVRNGRNAAIIGAIAGVTALGVGAAIASRNYDSGYGYGYAQPGYYAQPQPSYGYYGGPVAVEEPVYGYDEPVAVYAAPHYYEEPIVTYDNRPIRRHHAGGPGKRQMDNFRDSYR